MLTADELDILRKPEVQAYIREKMGPFEPGDQYFCPNARRDRKVKIIEDGYFDSMQYDSEGKLGTWVKSEPCCPDVAIIIPDCISRDSERPERGLWGCLKSFIIGGMDYYPYMDATVMSDQVIVGFKCGCASIISWIGTPRLALLKALEWQIGRTRGV